MDGIDPMEGEAMQDADPARRGGPETRLARTVRATVATAVATSPRHREGHRQTNWLRDVILGGQDGLVNILGIILGVIAAGGSTNVLLAAGFAAAITESISMGAVGYTSAVSQRDYYQAERAREAAEIDTMPEAERQEIRDIYATKGFAGDLLDRVVDTITANRDSWLATMMDEELHLQPIQSSDIFRSASLITVATLIGHLIPLLPFLWLTRTSALVLAIVLSGLVLFGVGVYSAVTLVGDWRKSGAKMVVIGLGAAGVGFLIGNLFHAAGA
jgi:vacuolar iron transporter family protein